MAFFNDFKEKFTSAAQSVTNKTKDSVEITRISGESRSIAGELAELYAQIGRVYVDSQGTDAVTLAPLCAKVSELRDRLESLERQKIQLRNQNRCPSCGAVMNKSARFCSSCGRRMPEPAPEPEAAPTDADVTYCPDCGAMRKDGDDFCAVCGHSYSGEAEPAPKPAPDPAPEEPASEDSSDEAPAGYDAE